MLDSEPDGTGAASRHPLPTNSERATWQPGHGVHATARHARLGRL